MLWHFGVSRTAGAEGSARPGRGERGWMLPPGQVLLRSADQCWYLPF